MPAGEGGDHEEADAAVLEQMGDVDLVRVGEQGVHLLLLPGGHAEAAVLDLHRESRRDVLRAQQDLGVRRGEEGGVLDEFGQQVDHVGDGVSAQRPVDGRDQLDARVLLDLGDGRPEHLRHGDRTGPLPAGDGSAEHGEVLGVPPDAGGEVVHVEEALEQLRVLDLVLQFVEELDLPVHEGLEAAGEVDEDLDLLFVADAAGEPGRLHDRRDGGVVRPGQFVGQQVELVPAPGSGHRGAPGRGPLAAAEAVDDGAQLGLAPGGGAPEGGRAPENGPGGPLRAQGGGGDGRYGDRGHAEEDDPEGEGRFGGGRPQDEDHGRRAAEGGDHRREDGGAQELGSYAGFRRERGGVRRPARRRQGAGAWPAVSPALAAVGPRGGCAKLRHQRPWYVGPQESVWCGWATARGRAGETGGTEPAVDRRQHTVVAPGARPGGSRQTCPPKVPLWYEAPHGLANRRPRGRPRV
nr:hypothetical protein [Streptomyces sp. t39]